MTISDIVNKTYFLTTTNASSYPAADLLISINAAYNRVASLVLEADSRWQWDDTNQSDLPIGTTTITNGQQDYSIPATYLTLDRIEVKDSAGNWRELTQIDQQLLKEDRKTALGAYLNVSGAPVEYDISSNSVFLYPTPNYTLASALKYYFTRGPVEFTSAEVTTGTKSPGFNSLFHDLIPLWVAFEYTTSKGLPQANSFFAAIQAKEKDLKDFYGLRNRDSRSRMTVSTDSNH